MRKYDIRRHTSYLLRVSTSIMAFESTYVATVIRWPIRRFCEPGIAVQHLLFDSHHGRLFAFACTFQPVDYCALSSLGYTFG